MATKVDIRVHDGVVSITVGASQDTEDDGSDSEQGCCAPVIIGPVVISGGPIEDSAGSQGGSGKNSGTGTGGSGKNSGTGTGGSGKNSGTGTGGGGKNSGTGTGGDGLDSGGCRAPVVIGPIVISGCSGQCDPSNGTDPQAVCVNPPLQSESATKPVSNFRMQTQEALNWCWAAVAVSINDFLDPPPVGATAIVPTWTQFTLANKLLGITGPGCSMDPGGMVCNQPESLATALTITANLRPNGALADQYLTFICIQSWVNAQLPIGARIKWRGKGAHFIALDGYKVLTSGQQMVHVQDPSPGASPGFVDYDFLVEDYEEDGYWIDTFLVTA